MNKITLAQFKEQQQISSLDEYENMDLHHAEDVERFKDIFPKSVEAIEKLPTDKIYVNTEDYQGDIFGFEYLEPGQDHYQRRKHYDRADSQ